MPIFLFTGYSAVGKSTVAQMLSGRLGIPLIGEREILHRLAVSHGFERTRYWLAKAGIDKVLDEALLETMRTIGRQINHRGVVVDGSYDKRLPEAIGQVLPEQKVVVVALVAGDSTRGERMFGRTGGRQEALADMKLIDGFKAAAGVEELISAADVRIDNTGPLGETMAILMAWVRKEYPFLFPEGNFPGAERF